MGKNRERQESAGRFAGLNVRTKDMAVEYLIVGLILIAASMLILSNLGNQYLWQDEAQTACIAKTILTHGIPLGHDGVNNFSQDFGKDYGKGYIWMWHPWFPFYLLAGFFAALGTSTFVARLPFALLGIGTVLLTYYLAKSLCQSRRAGVLASVALMLTVPFFLLVRQCRYYSPAMFFAVGGLYAYSEMMKGRRFAATWFTLSAVLLFHTHYVYCAALLATAVIHALIFHRGQAVRVMALSVAIGAINIPWIIFFSPMGSIVSQYQSPLSDMIPIIVDHLKQIGSFIVPPMLLVLPLVVWGINRIRRTSTCAASDLRSPSMLLVIFIGMNLLALALTATYSFFRFLAPIIPVCCIVMALILESAMRLHWGIGAIALAVLAAGGFMPNYIYELRHDYDGPVEGIVKYLNVHAHKGDVVATTYEDLPLKFYTDLRVVGGLTGEDLSPVKDADWVIMRKMPAFEEVVKKYFLDNVPWDRYRRIKIPYPDLAFENREDPALHFYATARDEAPVIIYQRVK